ncbi:Aste57867_13400 [Aphanomyces stellatus]|uniref:Aste57867_13400 protein n=1 Tax=Aphanomyces stellatus TaxID=120398 RepID=A0A485KYD0_9STRA|nr:hypothetical protein As57867_013350 [Aphanomyces stellatus]VFT90239.1 Aste57867_13400 [Aphanomyces stellatus]
MQPYGRVSGHRPMGNHTQRRSGINWKVGTIMTFPIVCVIVLVYEVMSLQGYTTAAPPRDDKRPSIRQVREDAWTAPPIKRNEILSSSRKSKKPTKEPVPPVMVAKSPAPVKHATITPTTITPRPTTTQAPITSTLLPTRDAVQGRRTMVLIANYRDTTRCAETLDSLFTHALHPDLLRVSIFDQIYLDQGELRCIDAYCTKVGDANCRRHQMVNSTVDADDATGPTRARYETEKGITDEDFCLAIDSHLVFVPQWDASLLGQWDAIDNPHAILTVYPKSTDLMHVDGEYADQMQLMCQSRIETADPDRMVQYGAPTWIPRPTKPKLMSQFAGGFNFGDCVQAKTIRNDPYTPYLFHGEEYSRATRLWTAGYDFYVPTHDIVFHWYEARKVIWEKDWTSRFVVQQQAKRRVRATLGLSYSVDDFDRTEMNQFQLGTKRTLEQWHAFSKIDPNAEYIGDNVVQFDNCGDLDLVPYNNM